MHAHHTRTHAAPITRQLLCFHVGVTEKGGATAGMKRPKVEQPLTEFVGTQTFKTARFVDTKVQWSQELPALQTKALFSLSLAMALIVTTTPPETWLIRRRLATCLLV